MTDTWTDPNNYVWSAALNTDTTPPQIDAGGTITVTAPSGESTSWCENTVYPQTLDSDQNPVPGSAVQAAYNDNGSSGYPVTKAEQELADACAAAEKQLEAFVSAASSVTDDAQTALNWLTAAASACSLLALIPGVGTAIAVIGGSIAAVDLTLLEPMVNDVRNMTGTAANATLKLMDVANAVTQHSMSLADGTAQVAQLVDGSVSNFWQALGDLAKQIAKL